MKNRQNLLLLIALLVTSQSCRKNDFLPVPEEVTTLEFHSNAVNEDYLIHVYLPQSYAVGVDSFPVLYQLDGHTTAGSVIENIEDLTENNQVRDVIVVAIDYKGDIERDRDYTPTSLEQFEGSGGSAAFYTFLKVELIPFISTTYRTDSNFGNTLRGHSLGGLFAAYVMFLEQPQSRVFSNFIIESPSWWWDDNVAFVQESQYAANNSDLAVEVYFAAGELEVATIKAPFEFMQRQLGKRNYPNFQSSFELLPDKGHLNMRENERGLTTIFGQ